MESISEAMVTHMPINIHVDTDRKLIVETLVGTVTEAEIIEGWQRFIDDDDISPQYWQFSDFTQVTKFEVSADFFRNLVKANPLFGAASRRALSLATADLGS